MFRVTPSATAEHNSGWLDSSSIPMSFVACCVRLELRPLPSAGVTRLRWYYEPLRHPIRPGLALASCRLIPTAIAAGVSRVASGPLCLHAVATTPAGPMDRIRSYCSIVVGLPHITVGSAPALHFSRPAQRSLALQPADSPSRLMRPSTSEAPAALLPPPPLQLLPGGAIQFPGGFISRCGPAPFTAH
jgi:hypothetical protein